MAGCVAYQGVGNRSTTVLFFHIDSLTGRLTLLCMPVFRPGGLGHALCLAADDDRRETIRKSPMSRCAV